MIEIKENNLIIDGDVKPLNEINLINGNENNICIFISMLEGVKTYPYSISTLYKKLQNSNIQHFTLVNDTIVNLNNVKSMNIKYYQYAGLSIYESLKEHAELYFLNIVCKNGKTETMSFNSAKQIENVYNELETQLNDILS